jgi:hypothetical protein
MNTEVEMDWSFGQIWNDSLIKEDRPSVERDYIYASELGGAFIDRYLKMKGVKPSNPPQPRAQRKFQAGNIWEWIVRFILLRAGILKSQQQRVKIELPGCLLVSGKLDFGAGGYMDWEKAREDIQALHLPDFIEWCSEKIILDLRAKYGNKPLKKKILECKAVSTYVYERNEKLNKANPDHRLQLFHYVYGAPLDQGDIIYVCKDDCRVKEFPVYNIEGELLESYKTDIKTISDYFSNSEKPPLEPELIWEEGTCKFKKNWKVEYSKYLTMLYGYTDMDHFKAIWDGNLKSWNYTFKRCINGSNMTEANKKAMEECRKFFPRFDELVDEAKLKGILEIEEELNPNL